MPKRKSEPIPGLGDRLRSARQRAGLTLRDAEPLTRIHYVDLCKYEIGEHVPNMKTLLKLCHVYQASPNTLLGWSERLDNPDHKPHDMDFVGTNFRAKGWRSLVENSAKIGA
jgi:transcriptional regulator with XRE-family HTH domain